MVEAQMTYKLITASGPNQLVNHINEHLAEGWSLHGSTFIASMPAPLFCQPMVYWPPITHTEDWAKPPAREPLPSTTADISKNPEALSELIKELEQQSEGQLNKDPVAEQMISKASEALEECQAAAVNVAYTGLTGHPSPPFVGTEMPISVKSPPPEKKSK